MSAISQSALPRHKYHADAFRFVREALDHTQRRLKRTLRSDPDDERAHVSGPELLHGIRELALDRYGLLSRTVFAHWGVKSTGDFGRIVFELIDQGKLRKTERDQLADFFDVYEFDDALGREYRIHFAKVGN